MATHEPYSTLNGNIKTTTDPKRPLANFPPSIWGDRFLSLSVDTYELKACAKAIEAPKEELRRLIISQKLDSNEKLCLFNYVYRLGLTYLFVEEVQGQLDKLFKELNMKDYDKADLYTISTNFQVFRQHGYKLSCDVFNKFKDYQSCEFHDYTVTDLRGLLSLYESTQLRIRGESILDEAMEFTKAQLTGVVDTLQGNLAKQVKHALASPFHRGMKMVEARLYFSLYEEELSTYDSLITKLAKAHFNYLQLLQRQELQILTKWGKDMEFQVITPYARNRIPDLYLWGLGLYYEPPYSQARIITSKIAQLICVLDDTYDAYATIEELRLLTHAINRWEISAMEQLPECLKPLYKILLNEHIELEKQLSKNGRGNSVTASKQAFQELARGYLKEAEWRHIEQVPSFQEYMKNGLITSTYNVLFKSSVMGMSEIATQEALDWYESHPKILEATGLLGRLYNDITTFQRWRLMICCS